MKGEMKQGIAKNKEIRKAVGQIREGFYVGAMGTGSNLIEIFNCNTCTWRDTEICPNGIKTGEMHSHKICSKRALFLKDNFKVAGTMPKYFQMEEAVKLKVISDNMLKSYSETGELHPDFHKISRNIITLIDKMRRQDEGIKIQGEMSVTMEDFRQIVDAQAKVIEIEDKNNRRRPTENETKV